MTDREKAIVMAHTGICMLSGDKFQVFHKYVEDIMGRPIWTHELGIESIVDEIKEKSKDDFIALCADESRSESPIKWTPVNERLPEDHKDVLIYLSSDQICIGCYNSHRLPFNNNTIGWGASYAHKWCSNDVIAWMPLPEPYKGESEE